jgi:hypothetical protein
MLSDSRLVRHVRQFFKISGLTALLCLVGPTEQARAEVLVGLTTQNSLISFDSDTPGVINFIGGISGLTAGDTLVGIDRRPQGLPGGLPGPNNARIYGVGVNLADGSARIYTLDEATANATLISTLAADPADVTAPTPFTTVFGTSFGVDFNPTVDRLRVVSNTGQNLRLNVDNGLTNLDVPLAYQGGDPNTGDAPVVTAVAYSNNFGRALTTVLRGVDIGQDPDALVRHTNPNGGLLMTSQDLPFNSTDVSAYDISGLSGTPYFAVNPLGSTVSLLFDAGPGGVSLVGTIGGGVALRGLAAPVGIPAGDPVPEPSSLALLGIGGAGLALFLRRRHRLG